MQVYRTREANPSIGPHSLMVTPLLSFPSLTILTNNAISWVLTQPEVSKRLVKWMIELSEYEIQY